MTHQIAVMQPEELLATLEEVNALLSHEDAHPMLPVGERWAGNEARLIIRRLLEPFIGEVELQAFAIEPASVGGVALRLPGGYKAYGGAPVCFMPSADGAYMFGQCCDGPSGFGMYAFKQTPGGIAQMMQYGPLMPGRGVFDLGGDGVLYVTGSYSGSNSCVAYVVPGYVRFTPGGPMPVPIPQVVPVIDADARRMADGAQSTANAAQKTAARAESAAKNAQATANQALAQSNQGSGGMDTNALKNELWNDPWYRSDMLYYWLSSGTISPGVEGRIGEIAVQAVGDLAQQVRDLKVQLETHKLP
jgi:hypothetical protein